MTVTSSAIFKIIATMRKRDSSSLFSVVCLYIFFLSSVFAWTPAVPNRPAPCEREYANYLSTPAVFPDNDPYKVFPGLHVLCLWRAGDSHVDPGRKLFRSYFLEAFPGGVDFRGARNGDDNKGHKNPLRVQLEEVELDAIFRERNDWYRRKNFRVLLRKLLGLKERGGLPLDDGSIKQRKNIPKNGNNNASEIAFEDNSLSAKRDGEAGRPQPFGVFDKVGSRLWDPRTALEQQLLLVFEGGQWLWPPVRKNFVRKLPPLGGGRFGVLNEKLEMETLSVRPAVFRIKKFLTDAEADAAVRAGTPYLRKNDVLGVSGRTNRETWLPVSSSDDTSPTKRFAIIEKIARRGARLANVPFSQFEDLQLLHYRRGEYCRPHYDQPMVAAEEADPFSAAFLSNSTSSMNDTSRADLEENLSRERGEEKSENTEEANNNPTDVRMKEQPLPPSWVHGHRGHLATAFFSFNSVAIGGETSFPLANGVNPEDAASVDCTEKSLLVKPQKGTLLLWYNLRADGVADLTSLHSGCTVVARNAKWAANLWMWNKPQVPFHSGKKGLHDAEKTVSFDEPFYDEMHERQFSSSREMLRRGDPTRETDSGLLLVDAAGDLQSKSSMEEEVALLGEEVMSTGRKRGERAVKSEMDQARSENGTTPFDPVLERATSTGNAHGEAENNRKSQKTDSTGSIRKVDDDWDDDDDDDDLDDDDDAGDISQLFAAQKVERDEAKSPLRLVLQNPSSGRVKVSFRPPSPDFEEEPLFEMGPHAERAVNTDAGHVFLFREATTGRLLSKYTAVSEEVAGRLGLSKAFCAEPVLAAIQNKTDGTFSREEGEAVAQKKDSENVSAGTSNLVMQHKLDGKEGPDQSGQQRRPLPFINLDPVHLAEEMPNKPAPCESLYRNWLSRPADLPRTDQPKAFFGLHVLCVWESAVANTNGDEFHVEHFYGGVDHREGVSRGKKSANGMSVRQQEEDQSGSREDKEQVADNNSAMWLPRRFTLRGVQGMSWGGFRLRLRQFAGFEKRLTDWKVQFLRQPFGIFDRRGRRLSSVAEVTQARFVLLFEGGQFMWPPVRKGFVRKVPLPKRKMEMETLSTQPALFKIRQFMSPTECAKIIGLARPAMARSRHCVMSGEEEEGHKSGEGSGHGSYGEASGEIVPKYARKQFSAPGAANKKGATRASRVQTTIDQSIERNVEKHPQPPMEMMTAQSGNAYDDGGGSGNSEFDPKSVEHSGRDRTEQGSHHKKSKYPRSVSGSAKTERTSDDTKTFAERRGTPPLYNTETSDYRTSSTARLERDVDPLLVELDERVQILVKVDRTHNELAQVVFC